MNRWAFAAALIGTLAANASAAQFKSSTLNQATDLAAGQAPPGMYDGSRALPAIEQMGMAGGRNAASQTAPAAPPRGASFRDIDHVPIPEDMEVVAISRASASGKGAPHDVAAPLGALIGLTAGFGIGLGLSKILA